MLEPHCVQTLSDLILFYPSIEFFVIFFCFVFLVLMKTLTSLTSPMTSYGWILNTRMVKGEFLVSTTGKKHIFMLMFEFDCSVL